MLLSISIETCFHHTFRTRKRASERFYLEWSESRELRRVMREVPRAYEGLHGATHETHRGLDPHHRHGDDWT